MKEKGISHYLVPTGDYHQSEYPGEYFKVRQWLSGFTGSNGDLLLSKEETALLTDGRYFIQAKKELSGNGISLYKMQMPGVPTITQYLEDKAKKQGGILDLGFDGKVVSSHFVHHLADSFQKQGWKLNLHWKEDLSIGVWEDRPSLPKGHITVLPDSITGSSYKEKVQFVRDKMKEKGCNAHFLGKLDDIMWLLNIRGTDVDCNPVALSYIYLTMEECHLFLDKEKLTKEGEQYLEQEKIHCHSYEEIYSFSIGKKEDNKILYEEETTNYCIYQRLLEWGSLVKGENPTTRQKAIKNEVELENLRRIHILDGVAYTKFLYWLKGQSHIEKITEQSAAAYLEKQRKKMEGFMDLSFPTISAYGPHAALMHYSATQDQPTELKAEGLYLVDSGGQYMGGTTDITRTIVLGELTEEEKLHYTAVLKGMLRLSRAKFLQGCTGRNLDILARGPVWDLSIDYQCGTGHGIGYMLNVHEGPQGIRWKPLMDGKEAVIEPGMVTSNEPGVYVEGSHGIRIENELICKKGDENQYGQFLYFETLTMAPIDLKGIQIEQLEKEEIEQLNKYHEEVFEKLSPYLTKEEKDWLAMETKKISIMNT